MQQQEVTSYLTRLLEAHGLDTTSQDDWIIPNGELPAIRCIWNPAPEGKTGRLDVHVLIDDGIMLEECFAGLGEGFEGFKDGFQNFVITSFHVLLAAFWDKNDPVQVSTEAWQSKSNKYTLFLGNFGTRGANGVQPEIPEDTFSQIESALKKEELTEDYYWARTFFCNIGNNDRIYEALLNNDDWSLGIEALKSVNWNKSEGYYSVRNFLVLKKQ